MSEFVKMQREARTIHVFTEKFTEGDWHFFYVQKLLQIPGEDNYYLLESKAGNRLLMAAAHYQNYGIRKGGTVQKHLTATHVLTYLCFTKPGIKGSLLSGDNSPA
jgi:hypothetical protein